ncbi:hypothetical protein DENSPDRAFT_190223 [Dentipellis sp. KUC8613]|nr:hypothetical protein DENSPDRAFT_190223 [Dentipellis sp. KUC8613]
MQPTHSTGAPRTHQPRYRLLTDQMPSQGMSRHVSASAVPARSRRPTDMTSRLPSEILSSIFQPLDVPSLVNSKQVSRRWRTAIQSSSAHSYDIALAAAGLNIGPPSQLSSRRRLQIIQDYERAWHVFPLGPYITIPKLSGNDLRVKASGNIIVQAIPADRILSITRFFSLRLQADEQSKTVTYKMTESFDDFLVDAAQDLLVLRELSPQPQAGDHSLQLHIKTLSTAGAHPDSVSYSESFIWTPFSKAQDRKHDIAIAGDHILIMCIEYGTSFKGRSSFIVWNWKTGETRLLRLDEPAQCNFLDVHHVLVMYQYSEDRQITVYDLFTSQNAWTGDSPYCCRFVLAEPDESMAWPITVHKIASSTTFHSWNSSSAYSRHLPDSLIRLIIQDEDIALDEDEDPVYRAIEFTIPTSCLIRLVLTAPSRGHTYDWHTWGPGNAYVVDKEGMWYDEPEFAMVGTRSFHLERTDGEMYLCIRDFDRKRVRERMADDDADPDLQTWSILHQLAPQSIQTVSSLPLLRRKVRVPQLDHIPDPCYCDILATEDAVIMHRFSSRLPQDKSVIVLPLRSSLTQ